MGKGKKKILMAQLGIGNIRKSKYDYFSSVSQETDSDDKYVKQRISATHQGENVQTGGESVSVHYSFLAYLEMEKEEVFTDLVLIGTARSSWKELLNSVFPENTSDTENSSPDEIIKQLKRLLSEKYNVNTDIVIIKNGATETEIEGNFNEIKKHMESVIGEGETSHYNRNRIVTKEREISIYLDISNAFRSVPMLVFATTNYLSVMYTDYNFKLEVCCSVLESILEPVELCRGSQKYKIREKRRQPPMQQEEDPAVIPMVDITIVSKVNQWTMAINEFYDNGSVIKLKQLIEEGQEEWFQEFANVQDEREQTSKKQKIINAFEQFSFAINSNNLSVFIDAVKTIIDIKTVKMPNYISNFINHLVDDFKHRFGVVQNINHKSCYGSLTLAIARWYADQKRFGDAIIALQEGMVTYVIENYYDSVIGLLKKRVGIGEIKEEKLGIKKLCSHDEYRNLISKLLFSYDEGDFDDFTMYCKEDCVEERNIDIWRSYLQSFEYICVNLRNPAMKVNYLGEEDTLYVESSTYSDNKKYSMEEAEKNINYCINGMIEDDTKVIMQYIEYKFKYLQSVVFQDFFISYRRKYNEKDDGKERTLKLAEGLSERNATVWTDKELERISGEFTPRIRMAIRNSRFFIIILGNNVFNRTLYQEHNPEKLDVFYEEIITAYKYFREEADKRIILVSFDQYEDNRESMSEVLLDEIQKIKQNNQKVGEYYDILTKFVSGDVQIHPSESICALVETILKIESVSKEIGDRVRGKE